MICCMHLTICWIGLLALCGVLSMPVDTATETTEWTTELVTEEVTDVATTEFPSTTSSSEDEDLHTVTFADEDGTTVGSDEENQPQSSQNIEIRWNLHQLIPTEDLTDDKSVDRMFFTDWPKVKVPTAVSTEVPSDSDPESGTTKSRPSDEPDIETLTSRLDPETPPPQPEETASEQSFKIETDPPLENLSTSPQPISSGGDSIRSQVTKFSSGRTPLGVLTRSSLAKARESATGRKIEGFLNFPPRILTPSSVQKENYPKIVRFNGLNRSVAFRQPVPSSPQWFYGPIKDVRKTLDNYRYTSTQKWLELSRKRPDEQQSTASELETLQTTTEPVLGSASVEVSTQGMRTTMPSSVSATETAATTTAGTASHLPTPEMNYATPESVYGTPESVYGTPETVHGTPEKVYGIPEQIETSTTETSSSDTQAATPSTTTESVTEQPGRLLPPPLGGSAPADGESALIPQFSDDYEPIKEGTAKARFESGEHHKQSDPWPLDVSEEENPAASFDQQLDESSPDGDSDEEEENEDMLLSDHDAHKYLVEEKTPDGYIVGEFGIVNRSSGNLRGVRYTAHGSINPQLIQDALKTFLSL